MQHTSVHGRVTLHCNEHKPDNMQEETGSGIGNSASLTIPEITHTFIHTSLLPDFLSQQSSDKGDNHDDFPAETDAWKLSSGHLWTQSISQNAQRRRLTVE